MQSVDGINNYVTMHVVVLKNDSKVKKIREELTICGINYVTIEIENISEKCSEIKCHMDNKQVLHHYHH